MVTASYETLHIGNTANVAYGNAKILRLHGIPSEVAAWDSRHLLSQPEWDDLRLNPTDFPDEFDFFRNNIEWGSYRRPEWFHTGGIAETPSLLDRARRAIFWRLSKMLAPRTKRRLEPLLFAMSIAKRKLLFKSHLSAKAADHIGRRFSPPAPNGFAHRLAMSHLQSEIEWLKSKSRHNQVVFAYVTSPIQALMLGSNPLVSIELGTMREFLKKSSPLADLLWFAYSQSDHILITNPDNFQLAKSMGLERISYAPHPVNASVYYANCEDDLRAELEDKYDAKFLLFAPARQNWPIKGNDKIYRAFQVFLRNAPKALLIVPMWGQHIQKSLDLIKSLGISDRVVILKPISEAELGSYYRAVDVVLDQFNLGVFGLITPKALTCGASVVTSYEHAHHEWCFQDSPPLYAASNEAEILNSLIIISEQNKLFRSCHKAKALEWVKNYYSDQVLFKALDHAARSAIARHAFKSN